MQCIEFVVTHLRRRIVPNPNNAGRCRKGRGHESLQVFQKSDGRWYDVTPQPGAFVINTGDIMQVWSNDRYIAPVHRVKAQRSLTRYSAPFFYNPSYECDYAPVSGTITEETPALYTPINWGKFRLGRFQGDFADVGAEVQISDFRTDQ